MKAGRRGGDVCTVCSPGLAGKSRPSGRSIALAGGEVSSLPCLALCPCRDAGVCTLSHIFKDFICRKGNISCAAVSKASA